MGGLVPIVIVEDQQFVARMFKMYLAGHKIYLAHDGATAMSIVRDVNPNLIITDIELPDMTGFDILRAVRTSDIPVIVLTASESYADRAVKEGAAMALTKPVSKATLLSAVKQFRRN